MHSNISKRYMFKGNQVNPSFS